MDELNLMSPKYKERYEISWCELCHVAIITCPKCKNSSCNGGGCKECLDDFDEFSKKHIRVAYYLSAEEKKIYEKCLRLKHFILETIGENDCINFKELEKKGKLSKYDEKMFEKYL